MSEMKTVIWAVDPMANREAFHAEAIALFRMLGAGTKVSVEPVYVIDYGRPNFRASDFSRPKDGPDPEAKRQLAALAKKLNLPGSLPPTVLDPHNITRHGMAAALLDYAKKQGAALIVVSTHGRTGLSRLLLGSFAETLLHHATVPILVSHGNAPAPSEISTILFVTDSPVESAPEHAEMEKLAGTMGASIHYHPISNLLGEQLVGLAHAVPNSMLAIHVKPGGFVSGVSLSDLCRVARTAACPVLILPAHQPAAGSSSSASSVSSGAAASTSPYSRSFR